MDIRKALITAILVLALALPAVVLAAQPDGAGPPPGKLYGDPGERPPDMDRGGRDGGPPSKERMERIRKKIQMVRIWRLMDELDLDEKTADEVLSIVRKYDKKRAALSEERVQIRRKMRGAGSRHGKQDTDVKAPDADALLKQWEKNREKTIALEDDQRKDLKKVLTSEQMLKYINFEENFRREMQQMLRDSRDRRDGGRDDGGKPHGMREPRDRREGPPPGMRDGQYAPER